MTHSKNDWVEALCERLITVTKVLYLVLRELCHGIIHRTLPIGRASVCGIIFFWLFRNGWDAWLFRKLNLLDIYPLRFSAGLYKAYAIFWCSSGFWGWALYRIVWPRRHEQRLEEIFVSSGLKNAAGRTPRFLADERVDHSARVLKLRNCGLPRARFETQKDYLESALGIYVDRIEENRKKSRIEITYGKEPMPTEIRMEKDWITSIPRDNFSLGLCRSREFVCDLSETPHLLIAGETASGKSTFLRQAIVTLYVNNPGYQFSLIDLKGGLEFQLFERLPRIAIISDLEKAATKLQSLGKDLKDRLSRLSDSGAKDLSHHRRGGNDGMDRHIVVIDKAAELFLSNVAAVKGAREVVSRIARQGRAAGMHVVIGTQRPDGRALDTQIKSNLPGKLCFQMADISSSMVVLGNARAKSLPSIPGRAIWQRGLAMDEIQTPYLSVEDANEILEEFRTHEPRPKKEAIELSQGW